MRWKPGDRVVINDAAYKLARKVGTNTTESNKMVGLKGTVLGYFLDRAYGGKVMHIHLDKPWNRFRGYGSCATQIRKAADRLGLETITEEHTNNRRFLNVMHIHEDGVDQDAPRYAKRRRNRVIESFEDFTD